MVGLGEIKGFFSTGFLGLLTALANPVNAALNDLYPGDYIPAAAGQNVFITYLYDRSIRGPFINGSNTHRKDRSTQTAIILGARYFDIAGLRANIAISGGASQQNTTDRAALTSERASGATDPKASFTIWPYQNDVQGNYIAINVARVFGSGAYDYAASQNIGQNRDRSIYSLALVRRTSPNTILEVTGELASFGANPEYGLSRSRLEQKSASAVTGFFRYRLTDQFTPYIGAQVNWGGETVIDGVTQGDSLRSNRLYLGLRFQNDPHHIFNIRLATDTEADWGYGLKRELMLRWTWLPK